MVFDELGGDLSDGSTERILEAIAFGCENVLDAWVLIDFGQLGGYR